MTARTRHLHREPVIYLEHDTVTVADSGVHSNNIGTIPVAVTSTILLGPGVNITTSALAAITGNGATVIVVGEHGVRWRCSGPPWGGDASLAKRHAELWATQRLDIAHRLFETRWGQPSTGNSIAGITGDEGARTRDWYRRKAHTAGVRWDGRRHDQFGNDELNDLISWAGACVNSLAAAAVHATGAIPQLGFIHSGASNSFAYDIADLHRTTFVAAAFDLASDGDHTERSIRRRCRDIARTEHIVDRMIGQIVETLQ